MRERKFTAIVTYDYLVTVYAKTPEDAQDKIEKWAWDQYEDEDDSGGYAVLKTSGALDNPPSNGEVECAPANTRIGTPEPINNQKALGKMKHDFTGDFKCSAI